MKRTVKIVLLVVAIVWVGGLAYEAATGQLGKKTEAPHRVGDCIVAGKRVVC
jgi:hypothetical protein